MCRRCVQSATLIDMQNSCETKVVLDYLFLTQLKEILANKSECHRALLSKAHLIMGTLDGKICLSLLSVRVFQEPRFRIVLISIKKTDFLCVRRLIVRKTADKQPQTIHSIVPMAGVKMALRFIGL